MCQHEEVRFLACSAADRMPGKWVCDVCGECFDRDPLGRTSIRYLPHPNPLATKVLVLKSSKVG